MKKIATGLALALGIGCAHPQPAPTTPAASTARTAPAAAPAPGGADRVGELEQRLAKLEEKLDGYTEALEFLQKVYDQQDQAPAPDAVFAVDITSNVKLGMVEGPPRAPVTIVEAWDFA